jgi:hypothetical protein
MTRCKAVIIQQNISTDRLYEKRMHAFKGLPDGIVCPHPDPVRNRPILPQLLRQFLLNPESLLGRL